MLKTRLIPLLLLQSGRMVKGKRFRDFRDTGDPVSAARIYNAQNADELMFIDIDAGSLDRSPLRQTIEKVAQECFMPLTVGGGVKTVEMIRQLVRSGADKVLINSAALDDPELIRRAVDTFGRQCIVVGIDLLREEDEYVVYSHCFGQRRAIAWQEHLERMQDFGAGEVLINSIDRDGMMDGYDLNLIGEARRLADIPVVACGGAGNFQHLLDAIRQAKVNAVACASLFHFGDNNPIRARAFLKNHGVPVKLV